MTMLTILFLFSYNIYIRVMIYIHIRESLKKYGHYSHYSHLFEFETESKVLVTI